MKQQKIAIIGPSDKDSFARYHIGSIEEVLSNIEKCCNYLLSKYPASILSVVPYKGIPVEAARIFGELGGEVHGFYDDSLSKSQNFYSNKNYCTSLFLCPPELTLEEYLVKSVDAILVFGISYGTTKELLANKNFLKPIYLFEQHVSYFPVELSDPLKIITIKDIKEISI